MRKTTNQFINEASIIHSNKYNYSLVEYKNNITKVIIKALRYNLVIMWESNF